MNWSKFGGQDVLASLSADLEARKAELQTAFDTAESNYEKSDFPTKLNDKKAQLRKFLKDKGLSPENIGEVATAAQQIAELDEQIKALQKERVPHQELYDSKDDLI
jgi:flagellar hook-associated protein FlgK